MKKHGFQKNITFMLVLVSVLAAAVFGGLPQQTTKQQQQEELEDYFEQWLKETVPYIITPDERSVFEDLTTDEEKEQFIEQFWYRRDPDQKTSINEFKEEHYRRIAYANEHFSAGWPGWMTDRGKIYIIHGPPDQIEENPSGGEYEREMHEGGGSTSVYPYQKWRYRHIEGVGSDVVLEFVDRDFSGVFRLALSSDEKDAFLFVPNAGFTWAEQLGMATRLQRPYFTPQGSYPLMNYRERDTPFARYETFINVQRPQRIQYQDLKELVDLNISYTELPLSTRVDLFRLNDRRFLAPLTVEIQNRDLTFAESNGIHQARVNIYGVITDLSNRLITEFEDEVTASFPEKALQHGRLQSSAYNRLVVLDSGNRYKLQLVAKDLNSSNVGTWTQAIVLPASEGDRLAASSLVLSGYIVPVQDNADPDEMFVLGDVQVRPSLQKRFTSNDYFAVYLQLYNVGLDQSTQAPSFQIRYRLLKDQDVVLAMEDEVGESVQYFSPQRMVLIKRLPLAELDEGEYEVEVAFTDKIRQQEITTSDRFQIYSP